MKTEQRIWATIYDSNGHGVAWTFYDWCPSMGEPVTEFRTKPKSKTARKVSKRVKRTC
jgi:hypothetical protein